MGGAPTLQVVVVRFLMMCASSSTTRCLHRVWVLPHACVFGDHARKNHWRAAASWRHGPGRKQPAMRIL